MTDATEAATIKSSRLKPQRHEERKESEETEH
jgi:hypothetical protein